MRQQEKAQGAGRKAQGESVSSGLAPRASRLFSWAAAVFLFFGCPILPAGVAGGWGCSVAFAQTDASQQNFHITPLKPVDELRREAMAAQPPHEEGKKKSDLVEVKKLDPSIHLDVRYASTNNFMQTPFYTQARAFLQRPAAEALVRADKELHKDGYGILIHDAYRPWYVTKMFWDGTPDDKKKFVADPSKGSMHNRGCAADVSLYDLKTGKEVPMPSGYDEMSERSYPNYTGGTADERERRDLLRRVMEKNNFTVYEFEWWHFDYANCTSWPIGNTPFEKLGKK